MVVRYNTKKVVAFWNHALKAYDNRMKVKPYLGISQQKLE